MELKVYNWEYFERWVLWYLISALIILLVVLLAILSNNLLWGILVLAIAWWYLYFLTKTNNKIVMKISWTWLEIWKSVLPRSSLSWFVLEYHTKKKTIHNIVILDYKKEPKIYTIADTRAKLEWFVDELSENIPMLDNYDQSNFYKFIRKIKL